MALILFVVIAHTPGAFACPNSPEDETIIEYFNEIEFSEDIYVTIHDTGNQYQLELSCPPQQSAYFPPPNFLLTMATPTNQDSITCNSGTIVFNKSELPQNLACHDDGKVCSFIMTLSNKDTQAVYSSTEMMITFTNGDNTYIPNLNPATMPVCSSNFNPCMLTGECSLSTTKSASLSLCDSADGTCTPPPTNSTYSYNENVYFQTAIATKLVGQR